MRAGGLEGGAEGAVGFGGAAHAGERDRQVEQRTPVAGCGLQHHRVAVLRRLQLPALPIHVAQVEVRLHMHPLLLLL